MSSPKPMSDTEPTIVIFRRWRAQRDRSFGDGIIALFPCVPGDNTGLRCESYEHHGQHGPAELGGVMDRTRAAAPAEYATLKRELESAPYGYVLDVRLRTPHDAVLRRHAALNAATTED